jgi:hypothetical protein
MRWKAHAMVALLAMGASAVVAQTVWAASRSPECVSWGTAVDGVVVDHEGHGVAGAVVVARPVTGGGDPLAGSVVTDRDGHFRIVGLAPGDYWFVSLCGGQVGTTPSMPVDGRLQVSISLGIEATRA